MPAKSKAQQKAAGAALSAKRGDTPKSELKGASKQMVESMTETQLEDFAKGATISVIMIVFVMFASVVYVRSTRHEVRG